MDETKKSLERLGNPPPAQVHDHHYPFSSAPDIVRSNQKDAYFQGIVSDNLADILRRVYGARFAHHHSAVTKTWADLIYLGLTTLIGNRTLGEEYCHIVQVEDNTLRLPALRRRAGYILTTVLLPYVLSRFLPALRRRIRRKLEVNLRHLSDEKSVASSSHSSNLTTSDRVRAYALANLDTITSPAPFYAVHLAIFYFTGAYHHLSKRIWGLRYIFTKRISPNEERVGYEVLGALLLMQLSVQSWLHLRRQIRDVSANVSDGTSITSTLPMKQEGGLSHATKISSVTHTPAFPLPRYGLDDGEMMQWVQGARQRRCTLCLEPMKDPSATTCGHVFCWACIRDWCREKPECPLCRQTSLPQHILPLRA